VYGLPPTWVAGRYTSRQAPTPNLAPGGAEEQSNISSLSPSRGKGLGFGGVYPVFFEDKATRADSGDTKYME
jgi:hypothetical protein